MTCEELRAKFHACNDGKKFISTEPINQHIERYFAAMHKLEKEMINIIGYASTEEDMEEFDAYVCQTTQHMVSKMPRVFRAIWATKNAQDLTAKKAPRGE